MRRWRAPISRSSSACMRRRNHHRAAAKRCTTVRETLIDVACAKYDKVIVVDDHLMITGSYNFTSSAERDNDENLVIVEDAVVARAYLEEFQRVYAQAQSPARCR